MKSFLPCAIHSFDSLFLVRMPENYRTTLHNPYRGIINRNLGLQWIRENANDGVVYFADDDNTYDIRLFDEVSTFFFFCYHNMWRVANIVRRL